MKSTVKFANPRKLWLLRIGELVMWRSYVCMVVDMYNNNKDHSLAVLYSPEECTCDVGSLIHNIQMDELQPFKGSITLEA